MYALFVNEKCIMFAECFIYLSVVQINTSMEMIVILIMLMIKHTFADYFFQTPWMWTAKSTYGKPGGLAHAGFHGFLTACFLVPFSVPVLYCLLLGVLDAVVHYHIDFVKSSYRKKHKIQHNSQLYWTVHGIDQFLHFMTYVVISILVI